MTDAELIAAAREGAARTRAFSTKRLVTQLADALERYVNPSETDLERAARAFDATVAEHQGDHNAWTIYETWVASARGDKERSAAIAKLGDLIAERIAAMRAALSTLGEE